MERRGRHPRGPEECRRVARELGYVGANALYVLSRNHDPYAKGTPAHVRDAEWFKELWEAFGVERGGHLRRLHYWADAKNVVMPTDDGSSRVRYENTVECDNRLNIASQAAR